MVSLLTAALIIGVIATSSAIVIRLLKSAQGGEGAALAIYAPDSVELPAGERAIAAVMAEGVLNILTEDAAGEQRLRIFGTEGVQIRATRIDNAP